MCSQKSLIIPTISVRLLDLKINALYNSIYAVLEFQQWLLTAKITWREKGKAVIILQLHVSQLETHWLAGQTFWDLRSWGEILYI